MPSDAAIKAALVASMAVSYASRPEVIAGERYAWDELAAQDQAALLAEHAAAIAVFLRALPLFGGVFEVSLVGDTPSRLADAVEKAARDA